MDGLKTLAQQLEEKKQENKKLKEGYSKNIKKQFILELITIKEMIEDFVDKELSEKSQKAMNDILKKINRIFDREGVDRFSFKEGTDLTTLKPKEYDSVGQVPVDDESKADKVCKTESVGYSLEGLNDNKMIIRKAKISVYSCKIKAGFSKEKSSQDEDPTEENTKETSDKEASSKEFGKKIIDKNKEEKE
tara:strand:- start:1531 stop:2103 length:573 start_codon:yes stop_codon:yes gene_type:complete